MKEFIRNMKRALAFGAFTTASVFAAGPNPMVPGYGWGTIVPNPQYPIVGENTHITFQVSNDGDAVATGVHVKLSFNDWGVTFMGWQQIAEFTVPTIAPGEIVTLAADHVFVTRTHTCLEVLIDAPTAATSNANPYDDRGQINLEVINADTVFEYGVPILNNGVVPLNLNVAGHCVDGKPAADGSVPGQNDCKAHMDDVKVQLDPGEEVIVPIRIPLVGLPDGGAMDFEVVATDLADPGNHNNVVFHIVKNNAKALKNKALGELNGLLPAVQGNLKNQLSEAIKKLQKELDSKWDTANKVSKNGGAEVFALDADVVRKLLQLMAGATHDQKVVIDQACRELVDSDRMIAAAWARDTATPDPVDMRDGDANREAGAYGEAIDDYKKVFQNAAH